MEPSANHNYGSKAIKRTESTRIRIRGNERKEFGFTPHINHSGSFHTLDEFLNNQEHFLLHRKNSSTQPIQPKQIPKINNPSNILPNQPKDVYNRLYMLFRKPLLIENLEDEPKKVAKKRGPCKVYQIPEKKSSQPKVKEVKKKPEPSTDPLLIQRFKKEFSKVLENVEITEERKVDYEGMIQILKAMHFLKEASNESPRNATVILLNKLWLAIRLPHEEFVSLIDLELYIAAILTIKLRLRNGDTDRELTSKEIKNISQTFQELYLNRKSTKKPKEDQNSNFRFKPELCKESLKLANKTFAPESLPSKNHLAELADAMVTKRNMQLEYYINENIIGRIKS